MSQDFMDPELFSDFIIEAKEHLETIEPNLLELEKAPDNLALLNDIFRPMHSLKGASGFLGLNRINQLAHRAENILDELRKGVMVVTSEIMDVILSATDALRQMIDNLEVENSEGDVEIDSIINLIDGIMRGETLEPLYPLASASSSQAAAPFSISLDGVFDASNSDDDDDDDKDTLSSTDWIQMQATIDPYALTAFGEGHLKDFIDEAREITENLNTGLLDLERNPTGSGELVNDLFRYFHNLKGNSGIIGFHELNSLTHEAETLLNRVRHGEMEASHELIDLLLLVSDIMDALVNTIDPAAGNTRPFDITEVLIQLQQAVAGGDIQLPIALRRKAVVLPVEPETHGATSTQAGQQAQQGQPIAPPAVHAVGKDDDEDIVVFAATVHQQLEIIRVALAELQRDSGQKDYIDAMYRGLVAIQNASKFMSFEDLRSYAERTAGLVDQGRKVDLDFSLMVDLLLQETSIISDMTETILSAPPALASGEAVSGETTSGETTSGEAVSGEAISGEIASGTPASPSTGEAEAQAPAKTTAKPGKKAKPDTVAAANKPDVTASLSANEHAPVKPSTPIVHAETPAPVIEPVTFTSSTVFPEVAPVATPILPVATPISPVAVPLTVATAAVKPATPAPASVKASPPAKPDAAKQAPVADEHKTSSTIRVDHEKLDHLMNLIGELIINRNRYTMIARQLEDGGSTVSIDDIAQNLSETTYGMARISDDLQDTIMKVRMVPVASVFSRFPRLVRDLSRKSGKEVDLVLEGEETELDKSVVEVIGDPLVHLIRNAVDHGVESEADRLARGKPAKGRVVLRAYHKGNSVAIEIEDDGQGLDPDKLRDVAVRKGLMTIEEAKQLDDSEARELIFAPGFSSAEKITDISGRGVGMDVVRTNIKNLKGSINISSEIGKGTRFTLSLPLTLAIIDALMINVSGETFAIPLDAVSETTKIESARLTDVKGRKAVTLRGEVLGIVELAEMLSLPRAETLPNVLSVVVIHDNDRRLGLVVDRLQERQEIVIKPLGAYLGDIKGISGATIMGDGSVILILDPHEIYLSATSNKSMTTNNP